MPSATLTNVERRSSSSSTFKPPAYSFPRISSEAFPAYDDAFGGTTASNRPSPASQLTTNGALPEKPWQPHKESSIHWANGVARHGRQKSLSEAITTIRTRGGSVSQNAQEIVEALKAPLSPKLVLLCGVWYTTSVLSNTSSKAILITFPKPITLTVIQFAFVSSWCLFLAWLARLYPRMRTAIPVLKNGIHPPSRELILTTLPMTAFQIGGHILTSDAMTRIPVSLVHTIKGLSPLFTVVAYRFIFHIHYSSATYLSLIPLTLGVTMACSANVSGNLMGLLCAFGSALLFVTQNIMSKKLFNEAARAEADGTAQGRRKPDKLNLLFYSSGLAFLLTTPIWFWSEGISLIRDFLQDASLELTEKPGSLDHGRLALEFIFNGTFHFGQNLVAFVLLSMVSPVTYSVASLIKRVFVIVVAILWFGNPMSRVQGVGIALTFAGLYLYDRTSNASRADRRARAAQTQWQDTLLPVVSDSKRSDSPPAIESSASFTSGRIFGNPDGGINEYRAEDMRDIFSYSQPMDTSTVVGWLPPGTKQEETWYENDIPRRSRELVS